ncbi:hypothetical protein SISSUDRAFT_498140 [Sistotremastrum suecicum HHB10207 ss-3]|uniref:Uncharacterized protein n=1 Tax=Sistotremastrum suecicum HHB10207 ss-3 TaxID=1314776 RepID=A0A166IIF5_9AGAM|nr:hypothetical protein SISSUDRAFT_498140 [Sistotremastrum suecicum HHB10207 ss-3]
MLGHSMVRAERGCLIAPSSASWMKRCSRIRSLPPSRRRGLTLRRVTSFLRCRTLALATRSTLFAGNSSATALFWSWSISPSLSGRRRAANSVRHLVHTHASSTRPSRHRRRRRTSDMSLGSRAFWGYRATGSMSPQTFRRSAFHLPKCVSNMHILFYVRISVAKSPHRKNLLHYSYTERRRIN